jgi:hypothetical protein
MAAYTTIDNPELYFQVKTWTGTGSSNALTLDGDEDMQPDYVMIKQRSGTQQWNGYDDLRGVQKYLGWNTNIVENTQAQGLTAFGSDGFTVGTDDMVNKSSSTYVAFCWKESATAGFDMVTYTGNQTARTISHSLSAVPHWMVIKNRGSTYSWQVYHHKNTSAPETEIMYLNQNAATSDSNVEWNDTAPTSSVFTVGTDVGVNQSSQSHIAYLWSEKQGFSKFGSYTGNGNADGPFIYTGFRPAFLIIKKSSATEDWGLIDNKRDPNNDGASSQLFPNGSNVEDSSNDRADLLSNGFKLVTSSGQWNASGATYIYMAFAEAPFVNSNGVPGNAK